VTEVTAADHAIASTILGIVECTIPTSSWDAVKQIIARYRIAAQEQAVEASADVADELGAVHPICHAVAKEIRKLIPAQIMKGLSQ
jgi:hypothetical protein